MTALVLAAALTSGLAGCGDSGDGGPDGSKDTGSAVDPAGTTYVVTDVTDHGEPHTLVEGSEVRLAFEDDRLVITAGCNTMSGGYTLEGTRLSVDGLAMTQMACDPALMEQDSWLAGLFEKPVVLTADGADGATITADDVVLSLADRTTVSPDQPLEGTRWELDSLLSANAVSSVPVGVTAWLEINDGKVVLKDGCNTGRGDAASTTRTIDFGPRATTRMACEGAQEVEQAFATVLDGATTYAIEEGTLRIKRGDAGLGFRAVDGE